MSVLIHPSIRKPAELAHIQISTGLRADVIPGKTFARLVLPNGQSPQMRAAKPKAQPTRHTYSTNDWDGGGNAA